MCVCVWGGGGGTLIFSCIRRLRLFWGFKILNFNILFFLGGGGVGGSDDFVDIFWGHHKIEQYLNVISMHFRVFSEGQGTEGRILLGLLKRQIFILGA